MNVEISVKLLEQKPAGELTVLPKQHSRCGEGFAATAQNPPPLSGI